MAPDNTVEKDRAGKAPGRVERIAQSDFPTLYGHFRLIAYEEAQGYGDVHLALVKGVVSGPGDDVLVRVHSQCLTGDALGSLRCDCGEQKTTALERIEKEGKGVFLYMRQEGRGIGLGPKMQAYQLQDHGCDTVEANEALGFPPDARDYLVAASILRDLGITRLRLLSNNPRKVAELVAHGLEVSSRVALEVRPSEHNRRYLESKRSRLGHWLHAGECDKSTDREGEEADRSC